MNNYIIENVNKICRQDSLPYIPLTDGNLYFTFAGYLVNKAVCLYFYLDDCKIDDVVIKTFNKIDWALIPGNVNAFENYFDTLFEESLAQSIYQKLLPLKLQKIEYIQSWIKNNEINMILNRLKTAKLVRLSSEISLPQFCLPFITALKVD